MEEIFKFYYVVYVYSEPSKGPIEDEDTLYSSFGTIELKLEVANICKSYLELANGDKYFPTTLRFVADIRDLDNIEGLFYTKLKRVPGFDKNGYTIYKKAENDFLLVSISDEKDLLPEILKVPEEAVKYLKETSFIELLIDKKGQPKPSFVKE